MRTGEVEANLDSLNRIFRLRIVDELVDRKRRGAEKMALLPEELATHDRLLDELERRARACSRAERPSGGAAVEGRARRLRGAGEARERVTHGAIPGWGRGGSMLELARDTLFVTLSGSQAYGTAAQGRTSICAG